MKKHGFTLGEVLIALAIVGVVAALVMPRIVNFFKAKELESRFKRADATIQQALTKSVNELGYTSIKDLQTTFGAYTDDTQRQSVRSELNEIFLKQFRYTNIASYYEVSRKGAVIHNFKTGQAQYGFAGQYMQTNNVIILPDGLAISPILVSRISFGDPYALIIYVDTNGPYKGPNRVGYDLFTYNTCDSRYETYYYFARRNKAINDNSKTYFEMLYK